VSKAPTFSIPKVVRGYNAAVKQRDGATSKKAKATAEKTITRLRAEWTAGNGGDAKELHETAFGG
jgi:hypothetical protein